MKFQEFTSLLSGLAAACPGFSVRRLIQDLDSQKRAPEDPRRDSARETARIRDARVKYGEFVRLRTSTGARLSQIHELPAGVRR